jgi:hypothetical protein
MPIRTFRRSPFVVALTVLVILQAAPPAWAWGRLGHRVISRLAEARLTPTAKAAIAELLEPGESLPDASLWANENRGRLPKTSPWHYVDFPIPSLRCNTMLRVMRVVKSPRSGVGLRACAVAKRVGLAPVVFG